MESECVWEAYSLNLGNTGFSIFLKASQLGIDKAVQFSNSTNQLSSKLIIMSYDAFQYKLCSYLIPLILRK